MTDEMEREIGTLQASMARTRGAVRETASALAGRTEEALDWRSYVGRFPAVALGLATALGVVVARSTARGLRARQNGAPGWAPSAAAGASFTGRSGHRVAERLERIASRVIDEAAEEAERRLLPLVVGGLGRLFDGTGASRHADRGR